MARTWRAVVYRVLTGSSPVLRIIKSLLVATLGSRTLLVT